MTTPARKVYDVLLGANERVIYFHREDPGWQKPLLIVLGLLTLVGFIGFFLLYAGLTAAPTAYIVTTRRFIVVQGKTVHQVRHDEVRQVRRVVAGSIVKWFHIDGKTGTTASFQVASNPPDLVARLDAWLAHPEQLEAAPDAAYPYDRT